ncbi:MAG TPA: hypothetical protein VNO70_21960 [Blastocatellia bacterium]|nr:hypothetical protein [Blastocatellia bacterium]
MISNDSGPLPMRGTIELPVDRRITRRFPRRPDGGATQPLVSPAISRIVEELPLTGLRVGDRIMIRTAHSVYTLTITNPTLPRGDLTGGRLGNTVTRASPVPLPLHEETGARNQTLRCGGRVIFLIETPDGVLYFFPSRIAALVYRKAGGEGENGASGKRP